MYQAKITNGIPMAKEHSKLEWKRKEELQTLTWAPADIPTVQFLVNR